MKFEYVTQVVLQKMKDELHEYKFVKRPLVSQKVAAARVQGDQKENAEYHAAREELSLLETRIKQMEDRIGRARIIREEEIPSDAVYILSTVVLKDLDRQELIDYKLVSPAEANVAENKISVASPVGKALIGRKKGEKIAVQAPAGKLNYQIVDMGTLIAAPIRYLVVVLLVLRLAQLGAGSAFAVSALIIGFVSACGTVLMTAVPFSVAPAIHKSGIPLYFLGVVVLQSLICIREWSLQDVPKVLPVLSLVVVVVFLVFATLVVLYEKGAVSRSTPVVWEWLAFVSSVVWVFAQSILLGKGDAT